jgi:hypothetical protein
MNREIHVRVCEGLRGRFPRSTRPPGFKTYKKPVMEIVATTNHVAYLRNSAVFFPKANPFKAATYSTVRVTSTI